jgi:hypothetical protein
MHRPGDRRLFAAVLCSALLLLAPRALSATAEEFYGIWSAEDDCVSARRRCEGRYIILRENFFEPGWGSNCKETKTWVADGKMRISATCDGEEAGREIIAFELQLIDKDHIKSEDENYRRCGPAGKAGKKK